MKHKLALLTALLLTLVAKVHAADAPKPSKPNILVILADDLGYADLGCYGGEIATPHLDALAAAGLRFTQFYNTSRCGPTRAALLTGYYPHQVRRDKLPARLDDGEGQRPEWAELLPRRLKEAGYQSYHSGKWHIDGMPVAQGFDHSYYLKDTDRFFDPKKHFKDDAALPPVEKASGHYSTVAIANHAIEMLKRHAADHADAPFFCYLAFNAPHFPLQALPEDIALYRDTYTAGWEAVREKRWQKMRALGFPACELSLPEVNLGPPSKDPAALLKILGSGEVNRPFPWASLTEEQKTFQARKMALHAAMIHRMDIEIGHIFDQIKAMGRWENTLVLFLSDNGASAEIIVRGDGHDPSLPPGAAGTFLCIGPGWATMANSPFRRHKTWTHEGGISTPLIASWPAGIAARGEFRTTPGHVIDVVPTLLELAGAKPRPDAPPAPGKSLVPVFTKDAGAIHDSLWWYHERNKAIQMGNWKAVEPRDKPWELYDLANDRGESTDLAAGKPEMLKKLVTEWDRLADEFTKVASADRPPTAKPRKERRKGKVKDLPPAR